MIEKYYEEELRYLYESGREFAKAHPDQARYLNIDAVGDRDPYVERLFEGFAFLTARIREKIDDSFPEFSEGMIDLLWPQLRQEVPSAVIMEFKPRSGGLSESRVLPRGTEVMSKQVGPDSAICIFTTTQTVTLNPLVLQSVDRSVDTRGKASLRLDFKVTGPVEWSKLRFDPIRVYLHAEMPIALALHELITRHCVGGTLSVDDGRAVFQLEGRDLATPAGIFPDETLLQCDSRAYAGYSTLMEYFIYPEKFLFVDFHGFEKTAACSPATEKISLTLDFDRDFSPDKPFTAANFRLYCSPAVNLFRKTTEPVPSKISENEYILVADTNNRVSLNAHSVISVTGIDRASGERFEYWPYNSFRGLVEKEARRYTTRYRPTEGGRRELILVTGGKSVRSGAAPEENLSIDAWFTNNSLPRDHIRENDITCPGPGFPDFVSFTNITRPTLPCRPPHGDEHWTFLSHLGATYASFATAESLRTFLRLYEWTGSEGRRRRIEAISDVAVKPVSVMRDGSPVRGILFEITVEESGFSDVNDLHLFGLALTGFFGNYVSINSHFELKISTRPSGRQLHWPSAKGRKLPV